MGVKEYQFNLKLGDGCLKALANICQAIKNTNPTSFLSFLMRTEMGLGNRAFQGLLVILTFEIDWILLYTQI